MYFLYNFAAMKRFSLFIIIATALLLSCSKPSLEDRAKKRIKPATEIVVNDPNSLIIQDVRTVFYNDSLCVLQFLAKAKNGFGGYVTNKMEYYMVRGDELPDEGTYEWYECVYTIDDDKNELAYMARTFIRGLESEGVDLGDLDEESAMFLYARTAHLLDDRLRKVE